MISHRKNEASRFGGETHEFRVDGVGLVLELGGITDEQAEAIERALSRAVEAGKRRRSRELREMLGVTP